MNVERSAMRPNCIVAYLAAAACGLSLGSDLAFGASRFSVGWPIRFTHQ